MKNIRVFVSENFQFLEVKFSTYLNRRVFVMVIRLLCRLIRVFVVPILDKNVFLLIRLIYTLLGHNTKKKGSSLTI